MLNLVFTNHLCTFVRVLIALKSSSFYVEQQLLRLSNSSVKQQVFHRIIFSKTYAAAGGLANEHDFVEDEYISALDFVSISLAMVSYFNFTVLQQSPVVNKVSIFRLKRTVKQKSMEMAELSP
jgi:hypothetical protein